MMSVRLPQTAWALAEPLPDAVVQGNLDAVYFGHCELVPRERLGSMADVQAAQDALLGKGNSLPGLGGSNTSAPSGLPGLGGAPQLGPDGLPIGFPKK